MEKKKPTIEIKTQHLEEEQTQKGVIWDFEAELLRFFTRKSWQDLNILIKAYK